MLSYQSEIDVNGDKKVLMNTLKVTWEQVNSIVNWIVS